MRVICLNRQWFENRKNRKPTPSLLALRQYNMSGTPKRFRIKVWARKTWTRLRSKLSASRLRKNTRYFINERRWTVATLGLSLLLSTLVIWWIYELYAPIESVTYIDLIGSSEYDVTNVEVRIDYSAKGDDTITTYLTLKPNTEDLQGKAFLIGKSTGLAPVLKDTFYRGLRPYDCGPYFSLCYRLDGSGRYYLEQHFVGNAFGHGSQNEKLNFRISISKNAVIQNTPVKITVGNLTDFSIDTLRPEPSAKYIGGFVYEFEPDEHGMISNEILITGISRQGVYATQFQLFLLGTLLGILVSISTSIVLEFIQRYESEGS
jgi:hypothetical protein